MSSYIDTVRRIMSAWDRRDFDEFLGYLTDDIEYHSHVGSPPHLGKDAIREFLEAYDGANSEVSWRILNFAETGNKLLLEGLVEQIDNETGQAVRIPYMGIFEFRDGRVCAWRDHFQKDSA